MATKTDTALPETSDTPGSANTAVAVAGMTCTNCARHVTDAIQEVDGVDQASVDLERGHATIRWLPGVVPDEGAVFRAIRQAGYEPQVIQLSQSRRRTKWSPLTGWEFNVVVGSVLTVPLLVLEWGLPVGSQRWYQWLAFALVTPIQVLCGARFYWGAWNQLRAGNSNMDTLVVLGSTTAFLYSVWGLLAGWQAHLFFMESASIITLVSIGHWVETKVSARAARSLRALLNLAPPTARLLDPGGAELEVPVSELKIGDQMVIKPGDCVPIDSDVIEGASAVDESMLTGEASPVNKGRGSRLYGGTTNLHGWLLGRVAATGEATALAQIIAVVQRAQSSRANIQKLGDRVSSIFVPVVVLAALGTGLCWGLAPATAARISAWFEPWLWHAHHPAGPLAAAIFHAAAVLIVACPCAMGLATPVAIMAGTNVAAERGILIRDGVALEKSGHITAVLFDKTGTITEGRLSVAATEDFLSPAEQALGFHKLVASLAKPSLHPLSQAVAALSNVFVPTADWQEVRGMGVQGRLTVQEQSLARALLRLGSIEWLRQCEVDLTAGSNFIREWTARGATLLGVAAESRLIGLLALRDTVKSNAAHVIDHLTRQGKSVYLVTGDSASTAAAVAAQVGVAQANVFSQIRPEQKAGIVQRLQEQGQRVAFVGDGINDAPALERADLGIAVARASDVAREAADIILLNSDIQAVPEALALAQATLRTIKQNLFWAFFYNAAGIPLAALGFLSPIVCAFAMGASDVIVIGNALRLRLWRNRR